MTTKTASPVDAPADRVLVLTRVFNAPRRLVFEAWTKKEHLEKWHAPHGFKVAGWQGDLQPGGGWGCVIIAPEGTKHEMAGVYREVVENELLVMTHGWLEDDGSCPWETLLTVRFEDEGGQTKVTLEQSVFRSVESRGLHHGGWSQSLDKLVELLAELNRQPEHGSDREIIISRVFDAPREVVWEAMADPRQVVKWWGPRGFTTTIEEMNVKPGGIWKHVMRGPDGTEYPNRSIFTEVVKPERIVYTHSGGKKGGPEVQKVFTWTFDVVEGNKTRLTIRQLYPSAEARDLIVREYGAIEGAKQTLARLAEHLAAGR